MVMRLLRPLHGWRAFFGEIGIVFVGILLALSAERLVQEYNWRQDARQARVAIKNELNLQRIDAVERLAVQRCLKGQINALYQKLSLHRGGMWIGMPMFVTQQGNSEAAQRVVVNGYRGPERRWVDEAWQTARSDGALDHLPAGEVSKYAQAYHRGYRILALQEQENDAGARLSVLAIDGPIDASVRANLLGTLAQADRANAYMELSAKALLGFLKPLLADLPANMVDPGINERIRNQRAFRGECVQPLKMKQGSVVPI